MFRSFRRIEPTIRTSANPTPKCVAPFQARRASISLAGGVNHRLVMDYSPVGPEGRHIRYGRFVPALQA